MERNTSKKKRQKNLTTNVIMIALLVVIVVCVAGISFIAIRWAKDCALYSEVEEQVISEVESIDVSIVPQRPIEGSSDALPVPDEVPDELPAETDAPATNDSNVTASPEVDPTQSTSSEKPTTKPTTKPTSKPTKKPDSSDDKEDESEEGTFQLKTINVNFDELNALSKDVIGYLYLQDSKISYPVVHSKPGDPGYYLDHAFDGTESISGALFVDSLSDPDFSDKNTVIHGHRMNNGSMFGYLNKYKKESYFKQHRIMSLYTEKGNYLVYVFAAYETDIDGDYSRTRFKDDADFRAYLDDCVKRSNYDTDIEPIVNDTIITLSTCVAGRDTRRFVVQGILIPM